MSRKQRGSALISALFIVSLVAIAATAMTSRLRLDIYRARLIIQSDKLHYASQAVLFWSIHLLKNNKQSSYLIGKKAIVARYPEIYQNLYPMVTTVGRIKDLQAKLNINLLLNKKFIGSFDRLLKQCLPEKSKFERKQLLAAISHWINRYHPDTNKQQITNFYLKQQPPYQPGHQAMANISELRLIQGISARDFVRLEPYLTALPVDAPVNIKTAPKTILFVLGNGLSNSQVEKIIQARQEKNEKRLQQLISKFALPTNQITLRSNYYLTEANVSSQSFYATNYFTLKLVLNKKKKPRVVIIQQELSH